MQPSPAAWWWPATTVRRRTQLSAAALALARTLLSTLPALACTLLSSLLSLPALRSRLLYLLARAAVLYDEQLMVFPLKTDTLTRN